jgi:hypothetical protein
MEDGVVGYSENVFGDELQSNWTVCGVRLLSGSTSILMSFKISLPPTEDERTLAR